MLMELGEMCSSSYKLACESKCLSSKDESGEQFESYREGNKEATKIIA